MSAPTLADLHRELADVRVPSAAHRARWAGVASAVLTMIGSYGCGALPVQDPMRNWPILGLLRHDQGPRFALALVYVGVAGLVLSWLALGRAVRGGDVHTDRRSLLVTAAWWSAPLLLAIPLFSRDLWSYAAQAHITGLGLDPYQVGPDQVPGRFLDEVQRVWVDSPAPYGPLWLGCGRLVSLVTGGHVYATVIGMRLLSVAGVALMARYIPRLAKACGTDARVAVWLTLTNPLLLAHFVAGGHNDALMLGLAVAGLTLVAEGRPVVGTIAVTLGASVKFPIGIVLAFCIPLWAGRMTGRHRFARAFAATVGITAGTYAVAAVATGLGPEWARLITSPSKLVDLFSTPGALISWFSVPSGLGIGAGMTGHALGFGNATDALVQSFRQAGTLVGALLCLGLWLSSCHNRARLTVQDYTMRAGACLLILVLVTPTIQPWYLLWPLCFAAAAGMSTLAARRIAVVTAWLALLVTPEGATLFDRPVPLIACAVAAVVSVRVILGPKVQPVPAFLDTPSRETVDAAPVRS